ncbi:MAG: hypothetical protein ACPKQO_09255 [Nitrososphaeraceae archaeon]
MLIKNNLSYITKRSILKGIVMGIITMIVYLSVVVFTTPNLPADTAISAAFQVNSIIIIGLAIGIGIQTFVSSYSKSLGCKLPKKGKKGFLSSRAGNGGSTALSSFFSFFSLVPLGCCGSWLFVLSFLPSVFGSGVSVIMIQYSELLSYLGLVIVSVFTGISVLRLKKELKQQKKQVTETQVSNSRSQ